MQCTLLQRTATTVLHDGSELEFGAVSFPGHAELRLLSLTGQETCPALVTIADRRFSTIAGTTTSGSDDGIAVMIKKPSGYDPANNDWYYEMRDLAGALMSNPPAGKIAMCIQCHSSFKSTDYLAGTTIR